jgi:parallel beta-helix repeat protein
MRRTVFFAAVAACALAVAVAVADGAATAQATLVVDDDGAQCAQADFATIQTAVDAASPGDTIRVCPGVYAESVRVGKAVTLRADPDAVEAVGCFDPAPSQLGDLDPAQHAILDPAAAGFSVALQLEADGIEVAGFVIEGASVGIDASDGYSGYRVHHNLIRLNTLFAVDFGSEGTRESRADSNCIRQNRFGLVSELDDDSLWPDNRGLGNARDLSNARIDHNSTFRNLAGVEAAGPGRRSHVTFDHNLSREDRDAILIQNSDESTIFANEATPVRFGIIVGGANTGLQIAGNELTAGQQGIAIVAPTFFIDAFTDPTVGALVADNTVTAQTLDGIVAAGPPNFPMPRVFESEFSGNVTSDNLRDGIVLRGGNADNVVRGNIAERNRRYGIYAQGAIGNLFEANQMSGNGVFDARDEARESNTWIGNLCLTDFPTGTICGVG